MGTSWRLIPGLLDPGIVLGRGASGYFLRRVSDELCLGPLWGGCAASVLDGQTGWGQGRGVTTVLLTRAGAHVS